MDSPNSVAKAYDRRLCINGCGFYGNSSTLGFCSKCYRDHKFTSHINDGIDSSTPQLLSSLLGNGNNSGEIGSKVSSSATESKNKTRQRCSKCDRKVGLAMAAIKCRCNAVFCAAHRLPEEHDCTFDHRTAGRLLLEKANPRIRADKINKMYL